MPRLYPSPLILLLAALIAAALAEFFWLNWLRSAEARFADFFVAAQAGKIKPDPDIVVVAADEHSLEQLAAYAGRWPWPRSVHGELVQGIEAQKPQAIVFDVMFFEPDIFRPDADDLFNKSVSNYDNVFFPTVRQDPAGDPYGMPVADLQAALGKLLVLPMLRPLLFASLFFFIPALQEYLRERREREQSVREFSRFVNPHVVKELIGHGGLSREGETRQVTTTPRMPNMPFNARWKWRIRRRHCARISPIPMRTSMSASAFTPGRPWSA